MLSQESLQPRRGKAPASSKQRFVSKQKIGEIKPWSKSTGPKTDLGRAFVSQNGLKPSLHWKLHSSDPLFRVKIKLIDQGIAALRHIQKQMQLSLPNGGFKVVLKYSCKKGSDGCEQWQAIALRIDTQSFTEYIAPRGDAAPSYVGDQQKMIKDASAAAWEQINKVIAILRLIQSSPIQKAIEVEAIELKGQK